MDKNTVLAFVLIALIFIVWQLWWIKTAPPPKPTTAADSTAVDTMKVAMPAATNPVAHAAIDTTGAAKDTIPERKITVDTDLYTAILSNKGGGLVSLKLKKYKHSDSTQINFLPDGAQATPSVISTANNYTDAKITYEIIDTSYAIVSGAGSRALKFVSHIPGKGEISKEFTFYGNSYHFDVIVSINGIRQVGLERDYTLAWLPAIPPTEKNLLDDYSNYKGGVHLSGELYKIDSFDDNNHLKDDPSGNATWAGARTKYFAYFIMPQNALSSGAYFRGDKVRVVAGDTKYDQRSISSGIVMPFGSSDNISNNFRIFVGPLDYHLLKSYNADLEDFMDWGWAIVRPFSHAVYWVTYQLHRGIPNYGFVILFISILMKLVTYPLTKKSLSSMRAMQKLAPKMEEIKVKYKNDPQKLQQATMKLYKEEGVNPFSGCLLLLPQMPLMFGLYQVFRSTIEFRQAYFMSYWPDLSQPDHFPYVMPVIMTVAMFFQQKLSMTDPKQKMMIYFMPLLFFFMMHSLPLGLVLYWTAFSVLSIVESLTVKKPQPHLNPQVK